MQDDHTYNVAADELRQFIEQYEQMEAEKKDVTERQKEIMAEAKARGYDTKVMKKVIALRKRDRDDIAEEEAILEMYKEALGMWPWNKRRHCPGSDQSKHGPSSTVPAAWAVLAQPGNAVASAADALARRARFSGCSSRSRSAAAKLVVSSGGTNSRASAGTVSGTAPVAQLTMGRPWLSASSKTMP